MNSKNGELEKVIKWTTINQICLYRNSLYERFHASGTGHLHHNNVESALLKHCLESSDPECAFHFEDVKILETGRYDEEIRFIESILLKYDRQNLNTCERSIELKIV